MIIPLLFLLRTRNVPDKFGEETKTHILCSVTYFFKIAVNEITWKNIVEHGRPQMTIGRVRIPCWIPRATNTHSKYAILNAFPLQQWLQERVSLLCYTYIVCLIFNCGWLNENMENTIFIVAPCILTTLMFLSPTNASLCYTYKMLKCTVKISHDCSYMFRSIWTIIREPMPNLAKVTILCRYSVKIRR